MNNPTISFDLLNKQDGMFAAIDEGLTRTEVGSQFKALEERNRQTILAEEGLVKIERIPTEALGPNPYQPREDLDFDSPEVISMAQSIETGGLDYEIRARIHPDFPGEWQCGDGWTRAWAFRYLELKYEEMDPERAEQYRRIPAQVLPYTDSEMALLAFRTGLQRNAYGELGLSLQMERLVENHPDITQEAIAETIGKSLSWVKRKMAVRNGIHPNVWTAFSDKGISEGHVQVFKGIKDERVLRKLLLVTLKDDLSRDELRERRKVIEKVLVVQGLEDEHERQELLEQAVHGRLTLKELQYNLDALQSKESELAWDNVRVYWSRLSPKKRERAFEQLWKSTATEIKDEVLAAIRKALA